MALDSRTPVASRSTFSSRSKMAPTQLGQPAQSNTNGLNNNSARFKSNMPPPSSVARLSAAPRQTPATSRIASLATPGYRPSAVGASTRAASKPLEPLGPVLATGGAGPPQAATQAPLLKVAATPAARLAPTTRIPPHTTSKFARPSFAASATPAAPSAAAFATPKVTNGTAPLNSRSSSQLSSHSSTTLKQRPSGGAAAAGSERPTVPDTNQLRKGLAKFSNPIECQRQFQTLSLKIRQLNEVREARDREIDQLQEQLAHSRRVGTGYALTVQYLARTLKLGSQVPLVDECANLKRQLKEAQAEQVQLREELATIAHKHQLHLEAQQDLNASLKLELQETLTSHSSQLQALRQQSQAQIDSLQCDHQLQTNELQLRIASLEADLGARTRELAELKKEHEALNSSYNKLEDTLTKDKDARVKYAQEKIGQLQKDVESLNSVLEMKTERIRQLEKDSILLSEVQNELMLCKDNNKSLYQQIEAIKATLDTKREQLENLTVDNEKMRLDLKRERKERRRMTMRTEQLEYVLNESCSDTTATNATMFNSSLRDIDTSDRVV